MPFFLCGAINSTKNQLKRKRSVDGFQTHTSGVLSIPLQSITSCRGATALRVSYYGVEAVERRLTPRRNSSSRRPICSTGMRWKSSTHAGEALFHAKPHRPCNARPATMSELNPELPRATDFRWVCPEGLTYLPLPLWPPSSMNSRCCCPRGKSKISLTRFCICSTGVAPRI